MPSFSVRILGVAIPNAGPGQPNVRVNKVITVDAVDYAAHEGADGDITAKIMESYADVFFLKELAKHCVQSDEGLKVICESFEIGMDDILGLTSDSSTICMCSQNGRMFIPLKSEIKDEVNDYCSKLFK